MPRPSVICICNHSLRLRSAGPTTPSERRTLDSVLLRLNNVRKNFGGVAALRDASLEVNAGEIHLLMGENGAGKSTLMKIVAGMLARDAGEFLWRGNPVDFRSPADAARHGIAMVHQESLLAPHLTVAENIFLGREPGSGAEEIRPRRHRHGDQGRQHHAV